MSMIHAAHYKSRCKNCRENAYWRTSSDYPSHTRVYNRCQRWAYDIKKGVYAIELGLVYEPEDNLEYLEWKHDN